MKWFIVLYLFFVLWPGCSIMETSLQTDIPYYICYRFVRTVMERIASSSYKSDNVKLTGVIEADEFYIKAGLKGRSYHNEILNSGRLLPRERGLKAWKGRGTFEKESVKTYNETREHGGINGLTPSEMFLQRLIKSKIYTKKKQESVTDVGNQNCYLSV